MSIGYASKRDLWLMKQADWKVGDTINADLRLSYGSREGCYLLAR
jgi:hypothetical protein